MPRFRLPSSRRGRIAAIVATATLVGAGSALAAWAVLGSGSSGGAIGTPTGMSATAVAPAEALYPDGTGGAAFQVQNDNGFPVTLSQATFSGPITTAAGCSAADISVAGTGVHAISVLVPAHGSATVDVAGVYAAGSGLQDGCKATSFTSSVDLVGASG